MKVLQIPSLEQEFLLEILKST